MNRRWAVPLVLVLLAALVGAGLFLILRDDDESETVEAGSYKPSIDPAEFTTEIDNPNFPLPVGTRWEYKGDTEDGEETIVVVVTSETREVMGVDTVVVRDTVKVDGELHEDTFDWYTQDADGNVWYFGEDTKEYDEGEVSTEGSWEAGVDGAQPGIVMKAQPKVGDEYRQEYYEGEAEDMAEVLSLSEKVTVPFGSYDNVVKTKDFTPLEPDVVENKYYAKGVGVVLEVAVTGAKDRVELIKMTRR